MRRKTKKKRTAFRRRRMLLRRFIRRHRGRPVLKAPPSPAEKLEKEKEAAAPPPPPRPVPKRQVLLCPGPVNTSPHVHAALAGPDVCHREQEFSHLLQTIRAKLVHTLGLDQRHSAVIINGSGTAALEAAVLSSVEPGQKLLVLNNGVYGSRIAQLARIHQIPLVEIRSPLTEGADLGRVAAALKRDSRIGTLALVHHETSTGMLNPIEEAAALAKKYRRRVLLDAISSVGGEKLELSKLNIGLCVGSAGKCLHGAPGLSFVLLSQEEAARVAKMKPKSLYLDLGFHLKAQEAGELPFTPAVPLVAAFGAALDDLARETVRSRITRYRERAIFLRQGFKKLGLQFLLEERLLSNTLTALWLPKGKSYAQVHDSLKKAGFIIYAGQSELKGKILRVAHMGQLLQADLKDFLRALKEAVAG